MTFPAIDLFLARASLVSSKVCVSLPDTTLHTPPLSDHIQGMITIFLCQSHRRHSSRGWTDSPPTEVNICCAPEQITSVEDKEVVGCSFWAPRCGPLYILLLLLRKTDRRKGINAMIICDLADGVWLKRSLGEGWRWPFEWPQLWGPWAARCLVTESNWTPLAAGRARASAASTLFWQDFFLMGNLSIFAFTCPQKKIKIFKFIRSYRIYCSTLFLMLAPLVQI